MQNAHSRDRWDHALVEGGQEAWPSPTTPCKQPAHYAGPAVGNDYRMLRTVPGELDE